MSLDLIIIIALLAVSLYLLELATVYFHLPKPLSRKIAHTGNSFLIIGLSLIFDWRLFIYVGLIFFCALLILRFIHPLKSLSDRSAESIGEIMFPLGIMVTALVSQNQLDFIVAVLILGISDTVAFYIGRNFKSKVLLFRKTILGSIGFFVSAFVILLLASSPIVGLCIALCLTLVEFASPKGLDNLTIPVIAVLLLGITT
jgi:phytol kinase